MGCGNSKQNAQVDLELQLRQAQLGMLIEGVRFESEMEKQIFMAANICRSNPKAFVQYIVFLCARNPEAKRLFDRGLVHHMHKMHKLPPIRWDEQAARACREQNAKIAALQTIPDGGTLVLYQGFMGRPVICEEFTRRNFPDTSGVNFVAMQLIQNWALTKRSPIIEPLVKAMGVNTVMSTYHTNVTNALYVKPDQAVVAAPQQAVVQQQMMAPAPVAVVAAAPMRRGLLKFKLQYANLKHHAGPPLVKMSPKVRFFLPGFEWISEPLEHGGHRVEWGPFARFEYRIVDPAAMARIEVLDHRGLLNNEPIGHCDVRVGDFIDRREAMFELFFRAQPAGQIMFGTEFIPEMGGEAVVVAEQPMMQQEQRPAEVVMAPAPVMAAAMGPRQGLIKGHLKAAQLQHHEGQPRLFEMSPKVRVLFPMNEWVSAPIEQGGRDVMWGPFATFEHRMMDPEAQVRIEVLDHKGFGNNEPFGHVEVRLGDFADRRELMFEIFWRGMPTGRVEFHSEFFPEMGGDPMMMQQQQPMMQQEMRPAEVVMAPAPMMMEGGRPGFLKMHLKHVRVEFHAGPPLERMSPQVHIRHGDFVWKSEPKMHAGKEAEWEFAEMEYEVFDHMREVVIEVRDHESPFDNQPLGVHRCPVGFFAQRGEWEDWLELRFGEFPAGKIHFKTHFRPN